MGLAVVVVSVMVVGVEAVVVVLAVKVVVVLVAEDERGEFSVGCIGATVRSTPVGTASTLSPWAPPWATPAA